MNTDIRVSVLFRGNRKRRKLAVLLGPGATDYIIDLWIATATSRPSGVLLGWDELDIALEANYPGDPGEFVEAMVQVGLLDLNEDGVYAVHDWTEHNAYASAQDDRSEAGSRNVIKGWVSKWLREEERKPFAEWFKTYDYQKGTGYKKVLAAFRRDVSGQNSTEYVDNDTNGNEDLIPDTYEDHTTGIPPVYGLDTPSPSPSPTPSPTPSLKKHICAREEKGKSKKKDKRFNPHSLKPDEVSDELWAEFLENRKHKKLQNSKLALTTIMNAFLIGIEQGYTYEVMIQRYVSTGMQRFKVEWMEDAGRSSGSQYTPPPGGAQVQARNVREALVLQNEEIARMLNEDKAKQQQSGYGNDCQESSVFLEYPIRRESTCSSTA